jgi:hypothetical protein
MFNMVVGHWPFVFYVCVEIFYESAAPRSFYLENCRMAGTKAAFRKQRKRTFGANSKFLFLVEPNQPT